jgi:uncharacterized membrane protein YuzA (DUF378 family)
MASMNAPAIDRRQLVDRRASHRPAMSALDYVAMALLVIGGLNWAMVGLIDVDVIATIFGPGSPVTRILYVLVGVAALYAIYTAARLSRRS